jgi:branched-subunit amino acid aminotransferase/4-amino-4-deoxychorismate lyase
MLPSYLAYKKAKELGCYDALLIDKNGIMLEGTRTNFCVLKDKTIYRAPSHRVLEGITFLTLSKITKQEGFSIVEKEIPIQELPAYDGAFITSTSTKIMPIRRVDNYTLAIPQTIKHLMKSYDTYLKNEVYTL